jgi:hypothetical protein
MSAIYWRPSIREKCTERPWQIHAHRKLHLTFDIARIVFLDRLEQLLHENVVNLGGFFALERQLHWILNCSAGLAEIRNIIGKFGERSGRVCSSL